MQTFELIKKKRDGRELSSDEIRHLVEGFISGSIPDYQMSAFLMAVFFKGMTSKECVDLTTIMARSGDMADLSGIKGFKVDKHSTGGVGDTTTIVLAPLVAAAGGTVAKMTGRELGHTGGTVDKLESIPGMSMELSKEDFIANTNRVGVGLMAQTATLAPADKEIYQLRNVTATVESIPLIAASIMSKKLAAGANGIVLDVKTGSGAFMREFDGAVDLAKTMVSIGEGAGRKMRALITSMEQPLGFAVGNAVEVAEAIDTLSGNGPQDLTDLVLALGSNMLVLSDVAENLPEAEARLKECMANGKGLAKFAQLIKAQGGDPLVADDPGRLPQPRERVTVSAPAEGYVRAIDALEVGMASKILGVGRQVKDDVIDPSIGIILKKKVGDKVKQGEALAEFCSDGDEARFNSAKRRFLGAYDIGAKKTAPPELILARVENGKVERLN